MDWNSTMTLINGGDTLLGLAILGLGARYLARRWLRRPPKAEWPGTKAWAEQTLAEYQEAVRAQQGLPPSSPAIPGPTPRQSASPGASPDTERTS